MRLVRLRIDRLPGIDEPYEIAAGGAGVHVVFGPNAVGKSSICRAVAALYWGDTGPSERTWVTGEFELAGESWRAERDGPHVRWRCEGEDRIPPGFPGSHHRRCFFLHLRDLVDPSPDGTRDIAAEIQRQMSGGFDLAGIVKALFPLVTRHSARSRRNEFTGAMRTVQEAEGMQTGLERRAAGREGLADKLEASSLASRRVPSVQRAVGLARRREEHAEIVRRVEGLPAALADLSGEEVDQVERLRGQIGELIDRERRLEGKLDVAQAAGRDARLSAVIDDAEIALWRQRTDDLDRIEVELEASRTDCSECLRAVEAALGALGGADLERDALTLTEHGRLFEFLREAEQLRTARSAREESLALLEDVDEKERTQASEVPHEDLRSAVDMLRRWLRSPAPETPGERARNRRGWLLPALAAVLAGGALAVFADPRWGLLLAFGAGVLATVLLMRAVRRGSGARAVAEEAFGRLDFDPPDAWEVRAVESRLRALEGTAAEAKALAEMGKYRAADRQRLHTELSALVNREPPIEERRRRLVRELGLDAMQPDAELVDIARALDELRVARLKHASALGRVAEFEARQLGLLAELADFLQGHGEPRPEHAATAKVHLGRLTDRTAQLRKAVADEKGIAVQREEVAADLEKARAAIHEIYSKASLDDGDLPGLEALVERLEEYRTLRRKDIGLESQIVLDREVLAEAGEFKLAETDRARLDRLAEALSAKADRADEFRRELADIEAEVKEARRGSSLQELIARREEARARLRERRDEAVFAEAGRFLVDAVEREYEQTQMPRVFERAQGHFSAFTHHGYELRLARDGRSPRLVAIDLRNNESRELDELSDGTRSQLLLAARMAFAEEVEQGLTLPLFLDEALDQSDPARFEAIAGSLGRIANDQGRQVFYLTSDPLDHERIRRALAGEQCGVASEIDLGAVRGRGGGAVTEPSALRVPPRPTVPMPGGVTSEEYGSLLRVPPLAPGLGHSRQHFFYLLSDDLELLRAVLGNGIDRAGQWETVARSRLAARLAASSETAGQIGSRVQLLEVFCEAWSQGRGRAVDRDVLAECRVLTERYREDVVEIAGELDGNPVRLLAALREKSDGRLRGFRGKAADALEEHLRNRGYLDDRPVLGEGAVRIRVLASPSANELPDGVASDCIDRWWAWAARMSSGGPHGPRESETGRGS